MPDYDNKVLTGAGVAELSQLIKEEIAQSSGSGGASYTAGVGIEISDENEISVEKGVNDSFLASNHVRKNYIGFERGYENPGIGWNPSHNAATNISMLKAALKVNNIAFCYFSSDIAVSDIQAMLAEVYPDFGGSFIVNYYTSYTYEKWTGNYCQLNTYVSTIPKNVSLIAVPYTNSSTSSEVGWINLQFIRTNDLPFQNLNNGTSTYLGNISALANSNQTLGQFINTILRPAVSTTPSAVDYYNVNAVINGMIQNSNFSHLVSEETTPTVNNTINWLYE